MSLLMFAPAEDGLMDVGVYGTVTQSSTQKATGTYSYFVGGHALGIATHALSVYFPERSTFHFQLRYGSNGGSTVNSGTPWLAWKKDDTYLGLITVTSYGSYGMTVYTGYKSSSKGTIAGWMTFVPTFSLVEGKIVIDDTNGIIQIKVNGSLVFDYSGDTKPGSDTGCNNLVIGSTGLSGAYVDDIAIGDDQGSSFTTWLNGIRFHRLAPTGAGNYSQWTPSSGNNWDCVDETPVVDSDYVYPGSTGLKDSYVVANSPATMSGIFGVAARYIGQGGQQLKRLVRIASTDYVSGTTLTLPGSIGPVFEVMSVNPATGSGWQKSDIDSGACELGMESV